MYEREYDQQMMATRPTKRVDEDNADTTQTIRTRLGEIWTVAEEALARARSLHEQLFGDPGKAEGPTEAAPRPTAICDTLDEVRARLDATIALLHDAQKSVG